MTATKPAQQFPTTMKLPELLALFEFSVHLTIRKWEDLCKETLRTGDSESHHAIRDEYEALLDGQLKMLDGCLQVSRLHADQESRELTARMSALRDQLATHYDSLFPKWQTLDDLEDILLAPLSLPNEVLLEMAKRFPPPQSWFEETIDPFAPNEESP